jgi:hypothetical protein
MLMNFKLGERQILHELKSISRLFLFTNKNKLKYPPQNSPPIFEHSKTLIWLKKQ